MYKFNTIYIQTSYQRYNESDRLMVFLSAGCGSRKENTDRVHDYSGGDFLRLHLSQHSLLHNMVPAVPEL